MKCKQNEVARLYGRGSLKLRVFCDGNVNLDPTYTVKIINEHDTRFISIRKPTSTELVNIETKKSMRDITNFFWNYVDTFIELGHWYHYKSTSLLVQEMVTDSQ